MRHNGTEPVDSLAPLAHAAFTTAPRSRGPHSSTAMSGTSTGGVPVTAPISGLTRSRSSPVPAYPIAGFGAGAPGGTPTGSFGELWSALRSYPSLIGTSGAGTGGPGSPRQLGPSFAP